MKPSTLVSIASAACLLANAALAAPSKYTGQELAGQAKVSLAQARQIAVKARPGKIVDQELEKEGGGTGLRYSFDIASGGKTFEIGVDAKTGKVLENGAETAAKETAEVKAEKAGKPK